MRGVMINNWGMDTGKSDAISLKVEVSEGDIEIYAVGICTINENKESNEFIDIKMRVLEDMIEIRS